MPASSNAFPESDNVLKIAKNVEMSELNEWSTHKETKFGCFGIWHRQGVYITV
jgi:hypothetical protein